MDGGAIEVVGRGPRGEIELALLADRRATHAGARDRGHGFMQWFHFRLHGEAGGAANLRIANAGEATYADAFEGYRVCASYDRERWFRVPTTYDGSSLHIAHTLEEATIYYAYFAPYSWARHEALLARAAQSDRARVERIGSSLLGQPMSLITLGEDDGQKPHIWINSRQHPGETMAQWFSEGVLERLLDEEDELSAMLLDRAVFHLVPNMNPDGSMLGNQRTNAAGVDLNRTWKDPDPETAPEVACVRAEMLERGVDLFLDIHGDERNPYCFAAGCEGNPSYSERLDRLEDLFMDSLVELDTDFQREYGYDRDLPGEGELGAASNWVGEELDCLSLTLEMPFKDDANHPDPEVGWSPERAKGFGRTTLEAVLVSLDSLRE